MKIITQLDIDPVAKEYTWGKDAALFYVDAECYAYFLDLDNDNYHTYLLKYKKRFLKSLDKIPNWDTFGKIRTKNKFRAEYNKTRQKFFLYNEKIYTYQYLGMVGHEIEIKEYNNEDLIVLLTNLLEETRKSASIKFFKNIGNSIVNFIVKIIEYFNSIFILLMFLIITLVPLLLLIKHFFPKIFD